MTIREYISEKYRALGLSEAHLVDMTIANGLDLDDEYTADNRKTVMCAMISVIEEFIFEPRLTNVSESGFSESWDFANIAKYYWWLCRQCGVKADTDILSALGISTIVDKTNIW